MDEQPNPQPQREKTVRDSAKQPWVPPKLAFVEPRLTKHGELTKVTGAFFGAFSPGANP